MTKQKRNLILLAAAAAVLVVAIVLFAVLNTTGRGGERATLQQLYEGLYTTEGGGINTIIDAETMRYNRMKNTILEVLKDAETE